MEKLILDFSKTKNLVSKICRDISISKYRPDYILGITRGGLIPATMISHYFSTPLKTINISFRDNIETELDVNILNLIKVQKNILIVDDINDTGKTFNHIIDQWVNKGISTNNVKLAVLVDNIASKCQMTMDYVGMEINKAEHDVWVDFFWENWWEKN